MSAVTDRLGVIRRAYGHRGEARTGTDVSFIVYAVLLVLLIVAFPVIRTIVILLAEPAILSVLQAPNASRVVSVTCGLLLAGVSWIGRVRGPVNLSPFFVTLLACTDMPRSRALLRPFATSTLVAVAAVLASSMLIGGVVVFVGSAALIGGIGFLVACSAFAAISCILWLAGQHLGRHAWVLPIALVALTSLTALIEPLMVLAPWGWVGMSWPATEAPSFVPAILLIVTAVIASLFVPRLLNSLKSQPLLEQGERWQSAATAAITGDVATALSGFRAQPTIGRTWAAVAAQNLIARFLIRDLLGTLRTPGRFLTASVFLILSCTLSALAFIAAPLPAWLPAAAGSATGFLALGVFSDGFRHAAEAAGAPPLYGYTTARFYLLHAILPATACIAATLAGGTIAVALGAPITSAGAVGLVALLQVLVRAHDSAKGPLPLVLLTTPVPSPGGDPTILMVLAWQADALLIGTIGGAITISLTAAGASLNAAVVAAVMIGGLLILLKRRLHAL